MARRPVVLLAALAALVVVPPPAARAALPTTGDQTTYQPLAPSRVMDTRSGTGVRAGTVGPGEWVDLPVPNPIAGSEAAVLNVTAIAGTVATVIRVYPASAGEPPTISNLNVAPRATVANLVVTRLGAGATVRFYNGSGDVHLIADLAGLYVQGGARDGFVGAGPRRLLDTRSSGTPLQAGAPRTLPVGPAQGVPVDATAVVLNVTAVRPTATTYLTVYPGSSPPAVSNLNPPAGSIVANLAVVQVHAATDTVTLLNNAGSTHVVVDLAGWYVNGAGAVFHPVTPFRALDTRGTSPVVAGSPRLLTLAGALAVPWAATALAVNVTAVAPTANTHITVYPAQSEAPSPPVASNLNLLRGQTVPNAAVVASGEGGAVRLATGSGSVHLVVDVAGWFSPAGDGWDISWPQCTTGGGSEHPTGGAFAVIGLTHKVFNPNPCFNNEWAWARTLGAQPSAYLNVDADVNNPHWADAGPRAAACAAKQVTADCGFNYGWNLAGYAAGRALTTLDGGKAFLWLDVEGPYSAGPFWSTSRSVNRAVIDGAIQRLRSTGYRVGIYSDRATSPVPDWSTIVGSWSRPEQNWVFRAVAADAPSVCRAADSFSGGPVVMEQISTTQSGQVYDVNHLCEAG